MTEYEVRGGSKYDGGAECNDVLVGVFTSHDEARRVAKSEFRRCEAAMGPGRCAFWVVDRIGRAADSKGAG